jgi:hypothetical protein
MAARAKVFSFADAWIFTSLGNATPPAEGTPLVDIVRNADMLNHAIPNYDEVRNAMIILFRHGLVDVGRDGPIRTAHGQMGADNGLARKGGLFSIVDNTLSALNSNRIKHPLVEGSPNLRKLTVRRYDEAVEKNCARMKLVFAKLTKVPDAAEVN